MLCIERNVGGYRYIEKANSYAKVVGCDRILSAQPPLSSGLGRGPLKAKTRIRIPLGAQESTIVFKTRIPGRGFYSYSSGGTSPIHLTATIVIIIDYCSYWK